MMRLNVAFHLVCALGALSGTVSGFVSPSLDATIKFGVRTNCPLASPLTKWASASEDHEEDARQGGSRFKEMMQQAQASGSSSLQRVPPPQYEPYEEPQQPASQPKISVDNLSVEDQALLFRQFMANQQQPAVLPSPPKQMRGGVDAQGRKIGRNRDADSIANSSDVYFAQLKRDSTIRIQARMRGDEETAQKVFADPSIKEIEEQLRKNPYLTEQEARSRSFIEGTSQEESLIVVPEKDKTDKPETYAGVSFRKKLEEAKRKTAGSGGASKHAPTNAAPKAPVQKAVTLKPAAENYEDVRGSPSTAYPSNAAAASKGASPKPAVPKPTTEYGDALDATIACVEGAITAYKKTPESLREGAVVTLHAALMAAANTCGVIIAENKENQPIAVPQELATSSVLEVVCE